MFPRILIALLFLSSISPLASANPEPETIAEWVWDTWRDNNPGVINPEVPVVEKVCIDTREPADPKVSVSECGSHPFSLLPDIVVPMSGPGAELLCNGQSSCDIIISFDRDSAKVTMCVSDGECYVIVDVKDDHASICLGTPCRIDCEAETDRVAVLPTVPCNPVPIYDWPEDIMNDMA